MLCYHNFCRFLRQFDRDTIAGLIRTGPQRVILKAGDKVGE
jgi:hypothetical protein